MNTLNDQGAKRPLRTPWPKWRLHVMSSDGPREDVGSYVCDLYTLSIPNTIDNISTTVIYAYTYDCSGLKRYIATRIRSTCECHVAKHCKTLPNMQNKIVA